MRENTCVDPTAGDAGHAGDISSPGKFARMTPSRKLQAIWVMFPALCNRRSGLFPEWLENWQGLVEMEMTYPGATTIPIV